MRVLGSYPLDEMAAMASSLDNGAMQTLKRQLMGARPAATPLPKATAPIDDLAEAALPTGSSADPGADKVHQQLA